MGVHETAIVDVGVTIAPDSDVWHWSHLQGGAVIGSRCSIGQNCFVADGSFIGDRCRIQNGVQVYEAVMLESDVFVGPMATFTNVRNPRAHRPTPRVAYDRTTVRQGATIGAGAILVAPVEIGQFAFVGAGAVVTEDVPPYRLVFGNPARARGWVCRCGFRLKQLDEQLKCPVCGRVYRHAGTGLEELDLEQTRG